MHLLRLKVSFLYEKLPKHHFTMEQIALCELRQTCRGVRSISKHLWPQPPAQKIIRQAIASTRRFGGFAYFRTSAYQSLSLSSLAWPCLLSLPGSSFKSWFLLGFVRNYLKKLLFCSSEFLLNWNFATVYDKCWSNLYFWQGQIY